LRWYAMHGKQSKIYIIRKIGEHVQKNPKLRLLDLGCGQSKNFLPILEKNPDLDYTGVEPNPSEAEKARLNVGKYPNARIITGLGYGGFEKEQFDIVVSLSVLEHVKNLEKFLVFSANKVKKNGWLIHLYDLGHALHPSSLREKIQVMLCNNKLTRYFVPESKIACYVDQKYVGQVLEREHIEIVDVTYHNMPALVSVLTSNSELADEVVSAEEKLNPLLKKMPAMVREKLLPSICLWGRKR
jgi:SAM-dependent methyltransferase